jgi:tyrosine decarboxylase/aspartate 1-decarboxylase
LQEKGLPENSILKELKSRLRDDLTYENGRIIGSMCTKPHPFARKLYARFIHKNLGDPGLFPAVNKLEEETIRMLGTLLSNPEVSGNIVAGGTEANILALWTAKKISRKIASEVVMPVSAHCSFDKAADFLGLKTKKVRLNSEFQVDTEEVEEAVNSKTLAVVGVAGTTGLGVVDPIPELSRIAQENKVYLHVDAAFGGFVLPFLQELGFNTPGFDFSSPGVSSITVDPHKMGLAPIPAGGILFRDERLKRAGRWKVSYLAGGETEQATLAGTRSGASAIAVWALLKRLGKEGYRRIVQRCMHLTHKLAAEIQEIDGVDIVREPTMNILGIKSEEQDVHHLAYELRHRRWAVALFPSHIRIVTMPHIRREHIEEFVDDLKDIVSRMQD